MTIGTAVTIGCTILVVTMLKGLIDRLVRLEQKLDALLNIDLDPGG